LEIGPAADTLRMWVADAEAQVRVRGASAARLDKQPDGTTVLVVSPHTGTLRIQLLIASAKTSAADLDALQAAAGGVQDLSRLIASDSGRFSQVLRTVGTTTETGGPYVIDTLTLPFDNPYKALLFTSGHDFFSDGTAAVCTVHGDVWRVAGIDRQLKQLRWRRFATGLFQPLGLKIVDDTVYVIGRDQITRLHDRNNDGEADFYENFNNDLFVSAKAHDYVTCLDTDPRGNFYFIHGKTGVMRVSADGSTLTTVADGFRNPNGMAVGPDGTITAAPQQGTWTPESSIIVVRQGGYYGFGGPRIAADRPMGWELPMCFIPRSMDNSGGAQVWVEGERWGPISGQMLHLSYGQCRLLLSVIEKVDGVYQGGTIKLPTVPADFESGIMRGRFNPRDGQLYVTGLRGWQTRAVRDGCFQRLRYTGGPLHLPTRVKTYTNGIKLTFTDPLDPDTAQNPENYFVEQWNYRWSQQYGSPDYSVADPRRQGRDEVPVVSATLMDSGNSVFLEMPGRQPVMQFSIDWMLNSAANKRLRGTYAHTINAAPRHTMPAGQLVRRPRPRRISQDIERRLQPGLQFRFRSIETSAVDVRLSRLVALHQSTSRSPTPFLSAGPFRLDVRGTLRAPRSGFYDFRIAGTGQARLWINDELIVSRTNQPATLEPVLLRKGHNRLRVRYDSPAQDIAQLNLSWKGYNFDWEPVPPSVFFHDSGADALVASGRRRL
ncbi:MAG: PA14 domain-containing protein, partial [Planctomycetaceae bacterium]